MLGNFLSQKGLYDLVQVSNDYNTAEADTKLYNIFWQMTLNIFLKAKNRVTGNFRVPFGGTHTG